MRWRFLLLACCLVCTSGSASLLLSPIGRASLLALTVTSVSQDQSLIEHRLALINYLMREADTFSCIRLQQIYSNLSQCADTCVDQIAAAGAYEQPDVEYPLLLLKLPGFKLLKKFPLIKTFENGWSWGVRVYWLVFLGFAVLQMGLYGAYAFKASCNEKVSGPGLSAYVYDEYQEDHGDCYMPLDMRKLWEYGPKNKQFQGVIALLSAAAAAWRFKDEIKGYVQEYAACKQEWEALVGAVQCFKVMREIYIYTADNYMIRWLPECKAIYDFFEVQPTHDAELAELIRLFDSMPLNFRTGMHFLSGYVARFKELLCKKLAEAQLLVHGIGALEVYVYSAFLLKNAYVAGSSHEQEQVFVWFDRLGLADTISDYYSDVRGVL